MKFGEDPSSWQPDMNSPAPIRGPRRELAPYGALGVIQADSELEDEPGIDLLHYLHILMKWKAVVIGAAALAVIVGLVFTLLTTPMYKASAVIQINRESLQIVSGDAVQPRETGGDEFFQTQYGLLRSRDLAERVVSKFNLADNVSFISQSRGRSPFLAPGR